jgi:hypothetical protein
MESMAILRKGGNICARAALDHIQLSLQPQVLHQCQGMVGIVDWAGTWNNAFSRAAFLPLRKHVDTYKQGDRCLSKKSYGEVLVDIYNKLSDDGQDADTDVVTLRVGALNSKEVGILACVLHCFQYPVEMVSRNGRVQSFVM